ncbi:hypothetical protein ACLK14_13655 [Escherichia coli]
MDRDREYIRTNNRQYASREVAANGAGITAVKCALKLEGNNPAGSVKDRAALPMIVEAEKRGEINRVMS